MDLKPQRPALKDQESYAWTTFLCAYVSNVLFRIKCKHSTWARAKQMIFALQMTLINIMLQEENNNEKCNDVTLTNKIRVLTHAF